MLSKIKKEVESFKINYILHFKVVILSVDFLTSDIIVHLRTHIADSGNQYTLISGRNFCPVIDTVSITRQKCPVIDTFLL